MRRLPWSLLFAMLGLAVIGAIGGDPRGTRSDLASSLIALSGLLLALAVGALCWWRGRRRALWLLLPVAFAALLGGLSGWIAGVELLGQVRQPARLLAAPGRVLFLIALTAVGMALPASLLTWLGGLGRDGRPALRAPGRART